MNEDERQQKTLFPDSIWNQIYHSAPSWFTEMYVYDPAVIQQLNLKLHLTEMLTTMLREVESKK